MSWWIAMILSQEGEGMWSRALTYLPSVLDHVGLIQMRFSTTATVLASLKKTFYVPVSVVHVRVYGTSCHFWGSNLSLKSANIIVAYI